MRLRVFLSLGALVCVGAGWVIRGAVGGTENPDEGPTRLSVVMPPGVSVNTFEWHTLAISADGRRLAYFTNRGLEIRPLESFESTVVPVEGGRNPMFSPDGRRVAYLKDGGIWSVSVEGGAPTQLSAETAYHATWGEDGRIYAADLGPHGIRVLQADGSFGPELTHPDSTAGEAYHLSPELLPSGSLLFTATGPSGGWEQARILALDLAAGREPRVVLERASNARFVAPRHLVYLDAGGQVQVREFDPASATVSGDAVSLDSIRQSHFGAVAHVVASRTGTLAYLPGSLLGQWRIVERQPDGTLVRTLESGGGVLAWPTVTPDGRSVGVSEFRGRDAHLWLLDRDGAPPRRLTFAPTENEGPVWSNDGREFLYGRQALGGFREIVRQSLTDSDSPEVLFDRPFHAHVFGWSPDRRYVVYWGFEGGVERVYLADLEGGVTHRVVAEKARAAALSPDGRTLVYCVIEGDGPRLYSASFPELAQRVQVVSGDGCWPRYSGDGSELYFTEGGEWNAPGVLNVVRRAGGSDGSWGEPRRFVSVGAEGFGYAVGGNPTRVFWLERDSSRLSREVRVVTEWRWAR